jgi:hypothetical protein
MSISFFKNSAQVLVCLAVACVGLTDLALAGGPFVAVPVL